MDGLTGDLRWLASKYDAPSELTRPSSSGADGEDFARPAISTVGRSLDADRGSDGSVCLMVR